MDPRSVEPVSGGPENQAVFGAMELAPLDFRLFFCQGGISARCLSDPPVWTGGPAMILAGPHRPTVSEHYYFDSTELLHVERND